MFEFRLALAMGRTREELLLTITARELTEWQAYDLIQPFGDERADLRSASIRQAVISVHAKKKSDQPTLAECMLKFGKRESMDWKMIKANIHGALERRRNGNC